jgi:hypothetical protein
MIKPRDSVAAAEFAGRLNPDGIDPNFFYGEFLFEQDEYAPALEHLQKALRAAALRNARLRKGVRFNDS